MSEYPIKVDDMGHRHMDGQQLVDCDEGCLAFDDPKTPFEVKRAYEHWRDHSYLGGCSHSR